MAILSAADLRDKARALLYDAGIQGFVRIAPPGGELLVTDALRYACMRSDRNNPIARVKANIGRVEEDAMRGNEQLAVCLPAQVLKSAGFLVNETGALLFFSPDNARLHGLAKDWECGAMPFSEARWDALTPAKALASRLLRCLPSERWSPAGRQLLLEALRLPNPASAGWPAVNGLRPEIAKMLRLRDRSGMHETGALLAARLEGMTGKAELKQNR